MKNSYCIKKNVNVDLILEMRMLQILWNNFTSKTKSDALEPNFFI